MAKHRFGRHRFGQQSLLGLYRWLVLSLSAFILASLGLSFDEPKDANGLG